MIITPLFFTKLESSFDLVQTRFPLSFISESSPNSRKHFGLPGFYQQGVVILLQNEKHIGLKRTINIAKSEEI